MKFLVNSNSRLKLLTKANSVSTQFMLFITELSPKHIIKLKKKEKILIYLKI